MIVTRFFNPSTARDLMPAYVEYDMTRQQIATELEKRMREDADNTLVLVVHDNDVVRGLLIAYMHDGQAFIWQGQSRLPASRSMPVMQLCYIWAKGRGATKVWANMMLRGKRLDAFCRRYGFQPERRGDDIFCVKEII